MKYRVINDFNDKQDSDTPYRVGEEYPKGSYKPTKKRIDELAKEHPTYKRAFIEKVKDEEVKNDVVKDDDANEHHE